MSSASRLCLALASTLVLPACAALSDDMQRAQASYENARYEDTLIWLTDLEDDAPSMDDEMRARYFYLRGMTEYRLGHRSLALHYLAVAREAAEDGAGLRSEWRQIMDHVLAELTPRTMTHRPPPEGTSGGESPPGPTSEPAPADDEG